MSRSLWWEANHSSWKGLFLRRKRFKSNKSWLYDPMIFPALFPSCRWNKVHAPGGRAQAPRPDRFTLRILQFHSSTAPFSVLGGGLFVRRLLWLKIEPLCNTKPCLCFVPYSLWWNSLHTRPSSQPASCRSRKACIPTTFGWGYL